jgi:two-component system OmpR family response regulator
MVIEDDTTMLSLLVSLLEIEGFEVVQANHRQTIDAVLGEIKAEQPDVLLLDIQLSNFSGFDLLRSLRQGNQDRKTKVLVSSGRDLSHECLQEGADSFLMKPYMPDELIGQIYSLLG